jgi:uncharacterized membrane protein YidH (DUF202 family)
MKTAVTAFLLFLSCHTMLSAQDASTTDRVYTQDGKMYEGHITEDKKGDYLMVESAGSQYHRITYGEIKKIQYNINSTEEVKEASDSSTMLKRDDNVLVTFDGYRATSRVTDKLVKRRNLGIAFTAGGIGLIAGGAILAALAPRETVGNGYGGMMQSPGIGTLAGVVMIIGGVGLTIPGAILWSKYAGKIRRAQQEL